MDILRKFLGRWDIFLQKRRLPNKNDESNGSKRSVHLEDPIDVPEESLEIYLADESRDAMGVIPSFDNDNEEEVDDPDSEEDDEFDIEAHDGSSNHENSATVKENLSVNAANSTSVNESRMPCSNVSGPPEENPIPKIIDESLESGSNVSDEATKKPVKVSGNSDVMNDAEVNKSLVPQSNSCQSVQQAKIKWEPLQRTDSIQKFIKRKKSAFIHGPPGSGKTTFLNDLIETLQETEGVNVIYIRFDNFQLNQSNEVTLSDIIGEFVVPRFVWPRELRDKLKLNPVPTEFTVDHLYEAGRNYPENLFIIIDDYDRPFLLQSSEAAREKPKFATTLKLLTNYFSTAIRDRCIVCAAGVASMNVRKLTAALTSKSYDVYTLDNPELFEYLGIREDWTLRYNLDSEQNVNLKKYVIGQMDGKSYYNCEAAKQIVEHKFVSSSRAWRSSYWDPILRENKHAAAIFKNLMSKSRKATIEGEISFAYSYDMNSLIRPSGKRCEKAVAKLLYEHGLIKKHSVRGENLTIEFTPIALQLNVTNILSTIFHSQLSPDSVDFAQLIENKDWERFTTKLYQHVYRCCSPFDLYFSNAVIRLKSRELLLPEYAIQLMMVSLFNLCTIGKVIGQYNTSLGRVDIKVRTKDLVLYVELKTLTVKDLTNALKKAKAIVKKETGLTEGSDYEEKCLTQFTKIIDDMLNELLKTGKKQAKVRDYMSEKTEKPKYLLVLAFCRRHLKSLAREYESKPSEDNIHCCPIGEEYIYPGKIPWDLTVVLNQPFQTAKKAIKRSSDVDETSSRTTRSKKSKDA